MFAFRALLKRQISCPQEQPLDQDDVLDERALGQPCLIPRHVELLIVTVCRPSALVGQNELIA
jgi:hypothetical protein